MLTSFTASGIEVCGTEEQVLEQQSVEYRNKPINPNVLNDCFIVLLLCWGESSAYRIKLGMPGMETRIKISSTSRGAGPTPVAAGWFKKKTVELQDVGLFYACRQLLPVTVDLDQLNGRFS
jgi:hypothetical protein